LYSWLKGDRSVFVENIISAPTPLRNKCEFNFGYRYQFDDENKEDAEPTKLPAVGFMVTGWAGGVSRPHVCQNIPTEACQLVDLVDAFLATSPLPPYDVKDHVGFWRVMTLRTSRRTRECMVIIQHTPPSGGVGDDSSYAEHFEAERARLVSVLTAAELQIPNDEAIKVTCVFFQEFGGISHPPPEHPVQVSEKRWQ
jgi:tRNA (uracil-5-)-methyltransferase